MSAPSELELRSEVSPRRHVGGLSALLQPVALTVHRQDVHMVRQPVQQRAGQSLGPEHIGPLVERQVGGHKHRAPLVSLAPAPFVCPAPGFLCRLPPIGTTMPSSIVSSLVWMFRRTLALLWGRCRCRWACSPDRPWRCLVSCPMVQRPLVAMSQNSKSRLCSTQGRLRSWTRLLQLRRDKVRRRKTRCGFLRQTGTGTRKTGGLISKSESGVVTWALQPVGEWWLLVIRKQGN